MRRVSTVLIFFLITISCFISCGGEKNFSTSEIETTEQVFENIMFNRPADWVVSSGEGESLTLESNRTSGDTFVIDVQLIEDIQLPAMDFAKEVQDELDNVSQPEEVQFGENEYAKIAITQNIITHSYIITFDGDAYVFTYGNFNNKLSEGARIVLSSVRYIEKPNLE